MITNLGFDFSAYGGSNPEYFASTAAAEARLNTLTGSTWTYDPLSCKFSSINYPGTLSPISTRIRVDFVDLDSDSTGFCGAGPALNFSNFSTIDLSGYGGSAFTPVTSNADIVTAFAALTPSLTVNVTGCQFEVLNWNLSTPPTNVEVNSAKVLDIQDGTGHSLTCAEY